MMSALEARVREWWCRTNHGPANAAFTSGEERNIALLLEDVEYEVRRLEVKPVTRANRLMADALRDLIALYAATRGHDPSFVEKGKAALSAYNAL